METPELSAARLHDATLSMQQGRVWKNEVQMGCEIRGAKVARPDRICERLLQYGAGQTGG